MNRSGHKPMFPLGRERFAVVLWVCLLPAGDALAQEALRAADRPDRAVDCDDSRQVTRVYSLKHAAGERVVSLLRSLFIVVDQQNPYVRVQFDERTESLVVTACERHHKQIGAILARVDAPNRATAPAGGPENSDERIRVYSVKHADGDAVVSVLRSLFLVVNHRLAYARFAYDAPTRSLIAVASEGHHVQIEKVLELLDTPADAGRQVTKEEDAERSIRVYPVRHVDGEELISKLRSHFVVVNHQAAHVRFGFDPRTQSLIVIAAEEWDARIRDTIAVLDQPPERRAN